MHGFAVMRPVVASARTITVPPEFEIVQRAGHAAGLLAYVEYREPSVLTYSELAYMPCMVRPRGRSRPLGYYVSAMYVDNDASLAAGRSIWGLPKRFATFERTGAVVQIRAEDGVRFDLKFRVAPLSRRLRSKMTTLQAPDGNVVRFRGEFQSQVSPASMRVLRFTASGDAWQSFRGARRLPRPAVAMSGFSSRMLAPDFPGNAAAQRTAAASEDGVLEGM